MTVDVPCPHFLISQSNKKRLILLRGSSDRPRVLKQGKGADLRVLLSLSGHHPLHVLVKHVSEHPKVAVNMTMALRGTVLLAL